MAVDQKHWPCNGDRGLYKRRDGSATNRLCDKPPEDCSTLHRGQRQGFVTQGLQQRFVTDGAGAPQQLGVLSCSHVCVYVRTFTHAHTCVHVRIYIYICRYACMYVCMYVCMDRALCLQWEAATVCIHIHVYVYIYRDMYAWVVFCVCKWKLRLHENQGLFPEREHQKRPTHQREATGLQITLQKCCDNTQSSAQTACVVMAL